MASEPVELGGRRYEIATKPLRQSSQMRRRIGEALKPLVRLAQVAPSIEIRNVEMVGSLLGELQAVMIDSLDLIFDLLCEYEPAVAEDREFLLDHAYDEEVIAAALVMVRQLFPFGGLLETLNGLAESATSKNSPPVTTAKAPKS